jgi:hypothetical protein
MLKQAIAAADFHSRTDTVAFVCSATPMRPGSELETIALTRTGRWKDPRSADRYRQGAVSEESRRADRLPVERTRQR